MWYQLIKHAYKSTRMLSHLNKWWHTTRWSSVVQEISNWWATPLNKTKQSLDRFDYTWPTLWWLCTSISISNTNHNSPRTNGHKSQCNSSNSDQGSHQKHSGLFILTMAVLIKTKQMHKCILIYSIQSCAVHPCSLLYKVLVHTIVKETSTATGYGALKLPFEHWITFNAHKCCQINKQNFTQ